jgi:hypothetical protein
MSNSQERAPDGIEPVTAYRVWLADRDGRLSSLNAETTWLPGTWVNARCLLAPHLAPAEDCSCGLHAAKALLEVVDLAIDLCPRLLIGPPESGAEREIRIAHSPRSEPVIGRVQLAGRVIEHTRGYRAATARVSEVLRIPGLDERAEAVAARFGVPIGPPPQGITETTIDDLVRIKRRQFTRLPPRPASAHEEPSSSMSGFVLLCSVFFAFGAIQGILMNHGPHWSEWWLWLIALGSFAVAAHSVIAVGRSFVGVRIWESRGSAASAGDGPRPPSDRPRPF